MQEDNLIAIRSADRMPRSIIYDGGFKISGTPLAFNGARNPGLLFLADVNTTVPRGTRRVIGTDEATRTLQHRKQHVDTIAVSLDRLFKLGRMDLRLLPSGMGPGASMLEINYGGKSILYTSGLRLGHTLSGPSAAEPRCDILIIDFEPPASKPPAPSTVKKQLIGWFHTTSQQVASAILVDTISAAFEAIAAMRQESIPVFAHRTIYNRLSAATFGSTFPGPIRCLKSSWPSSGVVIYGKKGFFKSAHSRNQQISAAVCHHSTDGQSAIPAFSLGGPEYLRGMIRFARNSMVRSVVLSPTAGEICAAEFKKAGFEVFFSRIPTQLKLPL